MEVCVDDMIVKSIEEDRHITDLKEAFGELMRHHVKLNPKKYAFGVAQVSFLTFSLIKEE